jgi:hypothetical protein
MGMEETIKSAIAWFTSLYASIRLDYMKTPEEKAYATHEQDRMKISTSESTVQRTGQTGYSSEVMLDSMQSKQSDVPQATEKVLTNPDYMKDVQTPMNPYYKMPDRVLNEVSQENPNPIIADTQVSQNASLVKPDYLKDETAPVEVYVKPKSGGL